MVILPLKIEVGDYIETKKQHPCGTKNFEVKRVGVDFIIKCVGCDKEIWIPRVKLEKRIKKIKRGEIQVYPEK